MCDVVLTVMVRSALARSRSSNLAPLTIPALLIKIYGSPKACRASAAAFTTDCLSLTSHPIATASLRSANILLATSSAACLFISATHTLQPSLAILKANYRPIPLPAPLMKTTWPRRGFLRSHPWLRANVRMAHNTSNPKITGFLYPQRVTMYWNTSLAFSIILQRWEIIWLGSSDDCLAASL